MNQYKWCNAPDCQLLGGSHTTKLDMMALHSTPRWLEFSIGSLNVYTNQHETFQHALSSLTRFLENITKGHPSHNYFKSSTFNC
ncbi:hypothetical protein GmHk_18G052562 [Glycine max]|nr:hypothetical protein GmHk_18G052562 [Glycine max]